MTYCRNCGVRLRRVFGRWWHAASLGPVSCTRPEPEDSPEDLPEHSDPAGSQDPPSRLQ